MIVRSWSGRATVDNAHRYARHFIEAVLPRLDALPGFAGASLLRRSAAGEIEFVVLTYWESMEAVARFAGPSPDVAVVDPEARAVLTSFDDTVLHYEVVGGVTDPIDIRNSSSGT